MTTTTATIGKCDGCSEMRPLRPYAGWMFCDECVADDNDPGEVGLEDDEDDEDDDYDGPDPDEWLDRQRDREMGVW